MSSVECSVEKKTYLPNLKWYQTNDCLFLEFEVVDSKNEVIKITENRIYFSVLSNNNNYMIDFELFENINVDESTYLVQEKSVKVILKKTSNERWSFLTKDKNIYKNNIKINWNNWVDDSDEEETQNPNSDFDFQKMMASMGGMGDMASMMQGMGGMGDMESMMQGMDGMDNEQEDNDEDDQDNEDNYEEDIEEDNHDDECNCCEESIENNE